MSQHLKTGICTRSEGCAADFSTASGVDGGAGTASGVTYAFSCDDGYTASGEATCTAGSWDTPTCEPDVCNVWY